MTSFRRSAKILIPLALTSLLSLQCGDGDSSAAGASSASSAGGGGEGGSGGSGAGTMAGSGGSPSSSSSTGTGGAGPGLLDPSFGDGGVVTVAIGTENVDRIRALAGQADGKALLVGTTCEGPDNVTPATGELLLARVGLDGALDPSFGVGGKVLTSVGSRTDAHATFAQPDGKIVVVGTSWEGSTGKLFVARYLPDGSLDTSFGQGGVALSSLAVLLVGRVALAPDGKIVIRALSAALSLVRLMPDGSLDPTFGTGGIQDLTGDPGTAYDPIAVLSDGKILGATPVGSGATQETRVFRRLESGAVDPAFGQGGEVVVSLGAAGEAPLALEATADGSILVGGKAALAGDPFLMEAVLLRLGADGAVDPSFGGGAGAARIDSPGPDQIDRLAIDEQGRIVASGWFNGAGAAMRFSPDGVLDATFGQAGIAAPVPFTVGLVAGPAGEVLLARSQDDVQADKSDGVAVRLTPAGVLDASFGINGVASFNSNATKDVMARMLIEPDGKILAAGTVRKLNSHQVWMTRLLPDAGLDPSFGDGGRKRIEPLSTVSAITRAGNGQVFVAGTGPAVDSYKVTRHDAAGNLDISFGTNGVATAQGDPGLAISVPHALALDAAGNVLVGGGNGSACVMTMVRFTPAGVLDPAFDGDGRIQTPLPNGAYCAHRAIVVQPDGKILAAGSTANFNEQPVVVRYEANGALDTTFGEAGLAKAAPQGVSFDLDQMVVAPDGKILVAGYHFFGFNLAVARLDEAGKLDPTFGDQGVTTVPLGMAASSIGPYGAGFYRGPALALLPSGAIFIGGAAVVGTKQEMFVVKLGPDGKLDMSFGEAGQAFLPGWPGNFAAYGMGLQTDGKIVLGGRGFSPETGSDFAFVRLSP